MPILVPASDGSGAFEQIYGQGPVAQALYPPNLFPNPLPTTLAAGATWLSGLIFSEGYRYTSLALTSTQTGSAVIQQYLDLMGTISRTAITTAIVANTPLVVDVTDLKVFVTFTVSISNTSGSAATLSAVQLVLGAG